MALPIMCLAASVTFAAQTTCQNYISCACGNTDRNITVCVETTDIEEQSCRKWSRCKTCQDGLDSCLQCPENLEGPFCSREVSPIKSRQKRQYYSSSNRRRPNGPRNEHIEMRDCENPGPPLNGQMKPFSPPERGRKSYGRNEEDAVDEYPEATRLEFSCDEGYELQGSRSSTCQADGHWSTDPPTCVTECGRSFLRSVNRILNGNRTVSGEWPWVVGISVGGNNSSRLICGGALLSQRTILTAAHCLEEASSFILRFGKFHRRLRKDDDEVLIRKSTRLIIHPAFERSTLDSDIALVMFEPKIRYSVRVQPVCLPTAQSTPRNLRPGRKGYVAGWGLTERNLQSEALLLASLPVVENKVCLNSYKELQLTLPLTRNMFCAGYKDADQSACSGDSGSPLVFYDASTEKFVLEGLVSFGPQGQCGLAGRYTIFTKVFQFLPWIFRNLQ